jgi:type II secretory pathway component PulF
MVFLKKGAPAGDAMEAIAGRTENKSFGGIILRAREALRDGKSLMDVLTPTPKVFRPKFLKVLSVGMEDEVLLLVVELLGLHLRNVEILEGRSLQGLDEEAARIYRDVLRKYEK